MTDAIPYYVPQEPSRWRALTLAALVHALLFVFLWIGVRWQNDTPATIEAEVWGPQPQDAAPRPRPETEVKPKVKELPKPIKPPVVKPVIVKPDIALEQEKKRKEKDQKAREEEKRVEKEKTDTARKKEADDKKRKELAEKQKLDKLRDEEMRRIASGVTGTGGTGTATKTQGVRGDANWLQKVAAKIRSNTIFSGADNLAGNPPVEYAVDLLPDGSVRGPIRKVKPSGVPGFDDAVLSAIEKSQPFPADKSGSVPGSVTIIQHPKDQ